MFDFLKKLLKHSTSQTTDAVNPGPVVSAAAVSTVEKTRLEISYVELIQQLWGKGISSPGSIEYMIDLANPFFLNPEKTALDLSAGLGGHDRALAEHYKTYIHGLERNKELVEAGQKLSRASKFGSHCTLTHYNPEKFVFDKKVDAVICRELFYTIANKSDFISKIADLVKSRGHLLITDFTCDDPGYATSPVLQNWVKVHPYQVELLSISETAQLMENHGFDVRISEDKTNQYRDEILSGLVRLIKFLKGKKITPQLRKLVIKEIDYWENVMDALNDKVRNTRFYAIKKQ
jgi:ubiquinone/menaquinone biosynthesis C-methylase UbiE